MKAPTGYVHNFLTHPCQFISSLVGPVGVLVGALVGGYANSGS